MNRNLLTMALLICGLSVNGQKKIDYVDCVSEWFNRN